MDEVVQVVQAVVDDCAAAGVPSVVETLLYLNETRQLGIRVLAMVRSRAGFERRYAHHVGRADLVCIEQDISKPFTLADKPDYIIHAAPAPNDPRYLDGTQWGLNNTGQSGGNSRATPCRRARKR